MVERMQRHDHNDDMMQWAATMPISNAVRVNECDASASPGMAKFLNEILQSVGFLDVK